MNYFRLGRVSGIEIRVNWSWLLIFALVSWSLSLTFGQIHHDWSMNLRWGMAMLAAILFFFSVLAHELAHSLVALARGVPVCNITLFMLGGVSNMQREPSTPAEELVITIVGPLTSLFLGAVCLVVGAQGIAFNAGSLTAPSLLARLQPLNTTLAWLGSVNIMIGFFNLIPAFPLDGGRIVRSLIWAASKDVRGSTRWATWLGQAIAWVLILGGVAMLFGLTLPLIGDGVLNGIWLILIGAFLYNAALAGYRQTVLDDKLGSVPVRHVMQTRVPLVSSHASLGEVLRGSSVKQDHHMMFVTEGQEVVGMISVQDVKDYLTSTGSKATAGEIMTPVSDLLYVSADEEIADVLDRLHHFDMRHIPVRFNDKIVGLLHRKDVQRLLQLRSEFGS